MGRYLRGTNGFSYKYAFAEQDENLGELPNAMGAGQAGLVPSFGGAYKNVEQNFGVAVIPLLRAIAKDGVAVAGEIDRVVPESGDALDSPTLEHVQYALGENIVEVARRLDEALEDIPFGADLEGYSTLHVERAEYPAVLAYINQFLATPATLDELRDGARVDALWNELGSTENYLPAMALGILSHAVTHDLPAIDVHESDRSMYAPNFWSGAMEWGPQIFDGSKLSSGAEWFARGIVEYFNRSDARESFAAAVAAGFAPATRWAKALGAKASLAKKPAQKKTAKRSAAKKKPAKKAATKNPAAKKPVAKKSKTAKSKTAKKTKSPKRKAKR